MNRTLLLLLGAGALGYYFLTRHATATPLPAGTGTQPGTTGTNTQPTTTTTSNYNSLAAIYARLQTAGAGQSYSPDQWNYILASQSSVSNPPDPLEVFPGVDRNNPMTLAQYWSSMSTFLQQHNGMSGLAGRLMSMPYGWN